jgi:ABC-type transport system involved in cytochrome c biogenesis permease component
MTNKTAKFKQNLRIIFAIAWKDILDGWKNKVVLTGVFTALFLVLLYRYLPDLTHGSDPPILVVLTQDEQLEEQLFTLMDLDPRPVESEADYFSLLRDLENPGLGIIIDEDAGAPAATDRLTLEGHYPFWMKPDQLTALKATVEDDLTMLLDSPVSIDTTGHPVYPLMDAYAYGKTFVATAGLLIGMIIMGLTMAPQLIQEEKQAHTLQAVLVSPATFSQFIIGKTIAVCFYTLLTTAISLVFVGRLVLNWPVMLLALALAMPAVILPGILFGTLVETKQQYAIWLWVLIIPTLLPLFLSIIRILPPGWMQVVDWWPTVALSRLIRAGLTYQAPLASYGREALYILALVLVFFGLTVWTIRGKSLKGG